MSNRVGGVRAEVCLKGMFHMGEARLKLKTLTPPVPIIDVICVTYNQDGPIQVLVQCFLNQTAPNWKLHVIHDGPNPAFIEIMNKYVNAQEQRISFVCTENRFNDYGHSLRAQGLKSVTGDYVLITNGDNYYVPRLIDFLTQAIIQTNADVVMFDMVHSHNCPGGRQQPPYGFFKTEYRRGDIDMGAAVVRSDLARAADFCDKSFAGDATYFEDVAKIKGDRTTIAKINQVLFVHN